MQFYLGSRYLRRIENGLGEKGSNAVTFAVNYALDSRYTKLCNQLLKEIKTYEKRVFDSSVIENKVRMDDEIRNQLKSLGYLN